MLEPAPSHLMSQQASDENAAVLVEDAIGTLPALQRGLDVNVRFNRYKALFRSKFMISVLNLSSLLLNLQFLMFSRFECFMDGFLILSMKPLIWYRLWLITSVWTCVLSWRNLKRNLILSLRMVRHKTVYH